MTKNSKKVILSLVATLTLSTSVLGADKVYAVVNGENITKKDIALILRDPRVNYDTLPLDQQKQILEGVIEQKIFSNEAIKTDIVKSEEYKTELERFKKNLAFQIWINNFSKTIEVSEAELKNFYEQNKSKIKSPVQFKASHILLKQKSDAQALINQLSKSKNLKEEFAKFAKEKSQGPSSVDGGALPWFTMDKMVPEFSNATAKLKVGTITKEPVESKFGFHIIYLEDKKEESVIPYDKVKNNLRQDLLQLKFAKELKAKAEELRKKYKIEYK